MLKPSTSPITKPRAQVIPRRLTGYSHNTARTLWVEGDQYQAERGGCPSCQRALLLLELKGLPYNLAFVDQSKPSRWLREVSATGKVPVLNDGGKWIAEASDIAKHLDEVYQPPLDAAVRIPCPEISLDSYLKAYLSSTESRMVSTGIPGLQHIAVSVPFFKRVDILEHFPTIRKFLEETAESAAVKNSNSGSAAIIGYWLGQGIPLTCSTQGHQQFVDR